MSAYNASNIKDHPMDQMGTAINELKTTLSSMQQDIARLETHKHDADIPDPAMHKYISFVKSAVRIAAGISLIWPGSLMLAGAFLIVAEVLGVAEEMV